MLTDSANKDMNPTAAQKEEEKQKHEDIYSDLDEYNKMQTLAILKLQAK